MTEVVISQIHELTEKQSDLSVLEEVRQDISVLRGSPGGNFLELAKAREPRLSARIVHIRQNGERFADSEGSDTHTDVREKLGYSVEYVWLSDTGALKQGSLNAAVLPAIDSFDSVRDGIPGLFSAAVEYLQEVKPHLVEIETDIYSAHTLLRAAASTGTKARWIARDTEKDSWLIRARSMVAVACHQHSPDRAEWASDVLLESIQLADLVLAPSKSWLDVAAIPPSAMEKVVLASDFSVQGGEVSLGSAGLDGFYGTQLTRVSDIRKKRRSQHPSVTNVTGAQVEHWTEWLKGNPAEGVAEWFYTKGQSAEEIIDVGWKFEEFPPIPLSSTTSWLDVAEANRTWSFTLHTWEFMDPVVREYLSTGDESLLNWLLEVAISWKAAATSPAAEKSMAWYDMALALRSPRLVGILHLAVQAGISHVRLRTLLELILAHQDAHESEESFVSRNNHGFYAALGQIVLAQSTQCVPNMDSLLAQGENRMRFMAEQQFHDDGGHVEHSPDYHRMLLGSFQQAITQGVITDPEVQKRIEKASEALGWFVQPNGNMLQFGDSPGRNMVLGKSKALNPLTRFITTDGSQGAASSEELFVLKSTGYVVCRSPSPREKGELARSSYLALAAGFHSRAHKHCDDLSLVWWDQGVEILVDGGRYGYGPQLPSGSPLRAEGFYYADPVRQFVESVWAHNTVAIDGRNHDRRRKPYGSGIISATTDGSGFLISGISPHNGWRHTRELLYTPGEVLTVIDTVVADDEQEHEYSVHFNINGSLDLTRAPNNSLCISLGDQRAVGLSNNHANASITTLRGSETPFRGWRSIVDRKLEPSWFVGFHGTFRGTLRHESIFQITGEAGEI